MSENRLETQLKQQKTRPHWDRARTYKIRHWKYIYMPQHTGRDITQIYHFSNIYIIKYISVTYDKSSVSLLIPQETWQKKLDSR